MVAAEPLDVGVVVFELPPLLPELPHAPSPTAMQAEAATNRTTRDEIRTGMSFRRPERPGLGGRKSDVAYQVFRRPSRDHARDRRAGPRDAARTSPAKSSSLHTTSVTPAETSAKSRTAKPSMT